MLKNEKKVLVFVALLVFAMTASAFAGVQTVKVAAFADPAAGSAEPLFTVDYGQGLLSGGWSGSGLTLDVPVTGNSYDDVTFTMTDMTFAADRGDFYTNNGPGVIRFYDGNTEILTVSFDRIYIQGRNSGLDAQDIYGDNVTISGIGMENLSDEQFGFSFANVVTNDDIVTATASFTSSAVPEPTTLAILAVGGLFLRKRK